MKTFKVASGPRYNPIVQAVQLNGIAPDERLTPKMARRACRVAIGLGYGAAVWDENGVGYKLYKSSARKLTQEQ